jgi:DNA-binding MarR family transcriptional regulator
MLKEVPRYECLLKAAEEYPTLSPSASEAFLHLLRTGDEVFATESAFLSDHNISQGRFTVLMLLHRCCEEPSTPAELAERAGVTRATMTGLIDNLEKDGLVSRHADADDRRTVPVRLTEAGRTLIERMLPDYFRCVAKIMQPLGEAERKQFVALLQKIQQGLTIEREATPAAAPLVEA